MRLTTDMIVGAGLVAALLASLFLCANSDLQQTLASGLIGYLGRTAIDHGGGGGK